MNILLLTQVLPYPPDSGPKVKTYHLLRSMASKHTVNLLSFTRGDQAQDIAALESIGVIVQGVPIQRGLWRDGVALLNSLLTGDPWMMTRDRRIEMIRAVMRLAAEKDFDVVIADQLNMAQYARNLRGTRKILDAHNALWLLYRRLVMSGGGGLLRLLLKRDWKLLKRYEGSICREFDAVTAVSDPDRAALQEAAGGSAIIHVAPIAVDTEALQPVERDPLADRILSIGTMYWQPNIDGIEWFLKEVLPLIRTERPGVVVEVVGAKPPQQLQKWAAVDENVHITGYVEDLAQPLRQAGVFIVPLLSGGGMRVKILEALARALPVVSTTIGAEGIETISGQHLLIADEPGQFARAVLQVLDDRALGERLGQAGRSLVQEQYDYRQVFIELERVYFSEEQWAKAGNIS